MVTPVTYNWEKLTAFCSALFVNAGVQPTDAHIVANSLIEADLRGVDSHGVVRVPIYLKRVEKNMINANATISVKVDDGSMCLVDGGNHFGAVIGQKALDISIEKAKQHGIGLVGVKHSNHFGTGAYYAQQAIQQNMALIVMSNASQTMPPTGGVRPFLGTNPLAVAVPTMHEPPYILDMATSVVARGKIIVAAQKGEPIPEGWAVDKAGRPTTDANAALEGAVLPLGGAKGYGISMFIDIFSGIMTGAGFGKYVNNMYENWDTPQNVGHMFIAIDISRFTPIELFKERMELYIQEIKNEPKAVGVDEIFIPGEIEYRLAEQRKREGIALSPTLVHELEQLGKQYGLSFDGAKCVNFQMGS